MAGEVRFTLTQADYVAANRDFFRLYIWSRRGGVRVATVLAICAAMGAASAQFDAEPPLPMAIGFAALALLLLIAGYGLCYMLIGHTARRLYRQQKEIQRPQHWSWDEAGLRVETPVSTTRVPWSDLHRWAAARRAILLFLNDRLFYVFPRSALSSETAADLERSLLSHAPQRP